MSLIKPVQEFLDSLPPCSGLRVISQPLFTPFIEIIKTAFLIITIDEVENYLNNMKNHKAEEPKTLFALGHEDNNHTLQKAHVQHLRSH